MTNAVETGLHTVRRNERNFRQVNDPHPHELIDSIPRRSRLLLICGEIVSKETIWILHLLAVLQLQGAMLQFPRPAIAPPRFARL